jgi:predicted Rossmann fold flavoprotein
MVAALEAAWHGAAVTLFERNTIVGRKLLVTGAGHCNLTNAGVQGSKYACTDTAWLDSLFACFGVSDLLALLDEIGVPSYKTSDGWYYPLSNSAQTVADAFFSALQQAGVTLRLGAQVTSIGTRDKGFTVRTSQDGVEKDEFFARVIVSAGGKAYPDLGSRGELFPVLEKLGHTALPKRPALGPVLADLGPLSGLQGLRLDAGVTLWDQKNRLDFAAGNFIFTQLGLNGPAVMDISHAVSARPGAKLSVSLNLLEFFQVEFDELLARKRTTHTQIKVFLGAFFPPKVALLYLHLAHLPEEVCLDQVGDADLARLVEKLKDTRLAVNGVRDFEFCQVSAGGVPVEEVDPTTVESRRVRGLYLTGETLDVVGPCGGYNLQYAFSSGAVAGLAAARE